MLEECDRLITTEHRNVDRLIRELIYAQNELTKAHDEVSHLTTRLRRLRRAYNSVKSVCHPHVLPFFTSHLGCRITLDSETQSENFSQGSEME